MLIAANSVASNTVDNSVSADNLVSNDINRPVICLCLQVVGALASRPRRRGSECSLGCSFLTNCETNQCNRNDSATNINILILLHKLLGKQK